MNIRYAAGRPLKAESKLADALRADGRPVYVIAGEAGIREPVLWSYYAKRKPIPALHLNRLCAVLECDPEDLVEDNS